MESRHSFICHYVLTNHSACSRGHKYLSQIVNISVNNLKILQFQKGELDTPPEVSNEWKDEIYYEDCINSEADSDAADDLYSDNEQAASDTDTPSSEDDDTESFVSEGSLAHSKLYTDSEFDDNAADQIPCLEHMTSIQK